MSTSSPAPEEAIRLLARIAEMHSDQAPDSLVLWCDNARQPETILTLGHARVIAAWNRRAGGEREQQLEAALKEALPGLKDLVDQNCPDPNTHERDKYALELACAALAGQTE